MTGQSEFYIGQVAPDSAFRAVFRKGQQVSPGMRDETKLKALLAEKQRIAERAKPGWRRCLTCGERFLSDGVHQRLCGKHRSAAGVEMPDQESPSYRALKGV